MPAVTSIALDADGTVRVSAAGKTWTHAPADVAAIYAAVKAGAPALPETAYHDLVCREIVGRVHAALGEGRLAVECCSLRADSMTGKITSFHVE